MPFARAIDADIHYEDTGGNGPLVLLAHEFFMDRTMFAEQMDALAPEFRVVTWDARGHGRTRDQGLPFTYWTAARDALTVLDHLGAERAVVGGTAQGGFTALRTALIAPERVSALILISTEAHGPTPEQSTATQRFLAEWYDDGSRPRAVQRLAHWLIGDHDRHRTVWTERWLTHDRHRIEVAAGCLLGRDSVLDRLAEITCPALVVHASHSGIARERGKLLAESIPGSTFVEIDGARLAVTMTHPDPVNHAIRQFLRGRAVSTAVRGR
ncbi:alpha/beta fold hydrolase [Nocardia cyriacigeorgica]|uniref:Alpha/beta fold hydrolase n=2 Tax=Nocardia cyriacigeorgica TaxID=135487 RepID=A0A6P1CXJ4_9NOCA|nr:alpha/beta fold hydrolase [Nocardia cyriacigeorgica]MBF6083559.1 alpha/beta fold hydrolase [Nocardia cyriacigeorgica]MBF6289064.1 alpha/beta fold hydrolase [Nocardia cyriacigeorgica]MBF6425614.1 alpha/beta fold hydrolase [Nocardia cyriacigeorgica]NEW36224.1 alpha/beta fold hydrolase [Nocardia cyriacigeorgica]CCF61761.1 putative 3-oxoadipate enol-lactone hydrolase [Nocardia cyriacigeorgica GUH-2]